MKKWIIIVAASIVGMVLVIVVSRRGPSPEAMLQEGKVAFREKRFEESVKSLDAYLAVREHDAVTWVIRGNALLQLERLPEAEISFLTALKIDGRNVQGLNAMGVLCRRRNDLDKAIDYYRRALDVSSDYVPTHLCLATIEMERGNAPQSLKHARHAYDLQMDNPTAAAYLAVAYHLNGMIEKRDEFTAKARELGYPEMDELARIYKEKKPLTTP